MSAVAIERTGADSPSRLLLLSPQTVALRRIIELRSQRAYFTETITEAEARLAAPASQNGQKRAKMVDAVGLARQGLRQATRIVAEAEAAYREMFDAEPGGKVCQDCGLPMAEADFPRHSSTGLPRCYCRSCYRARQRAEYGRSRVHRRRYANTYYSANRDRLRPRLNEQARGRRRKQAAIPVEASRNQL